MRNLKSFSRSQLAEIATAYAETEYTCSHSFFEKEYDISSSTFYSILAKAVVVSAIDDRTVKRIVKKSSFNSTAKAGIKSGNRSKRKYDKLISKRNAYIPKNNEITFWAHLYSNSPLNKKSFCLYYKIEPKLFDRIILFSIKHSLISDEDFTKLKEKSFSHYGTSDYLNSFWCQMETLKKQANC